MSRSWFWPLVGLQFVVPLALLTQPRPARFGWQMFADYRTSPNFVLVDDRGQEHAVEATRYRVTFRNDVPADEALAGHLLALFPEAVAVRWRTGDGAEGEVRR
jgi:hypothetical protein